MMQPPAFAVGDPLHTALPPLVPRRGVRMLPCWCLTSTLRAMYEPCSHVVQLYGEDVPLLGRQVGRFIGEGLALGEPALVIAGPENRDTFMCQLSHDGHDPIAAIRAGQLVLIDAATLLGEMMPGGELSWEGFDRTAGAAVRALRERTGAPRLRAYGEMVGLLWQAAQPSNAAILESYWNRLLAGAAVSLFCSYPIDLMDPSLDTDALQPLIEAHTRLLSNGPAFDSALNRAITTLLGPPMPEGDALALWLRQAHPGRAAEVLTRARHYQATQLTAG
jgi:hypothetical protein